MPVDRMFVGVTDNDWFDLLRVSGCDEVNFWKPSGASFRALSENEMFLFKLHSPQNSIVGGGFFVRATVLPAFLAWEAFGVKNGVRDVNELYTRIGKYRRSTNTLMENPQIGCIILTEPFFFERDEWIPVPEDWSPNIVTGKTYTTDTVTGRRLFSQVSERLASHAVPAAESSPLLLREDTRYTESMTKHRIGQGGFRVSVTDAYQRRCAITGEKTLPVLEAAHIKPYAENGPHALSNGILLKSDYHTLLDKGYMTITPDYHIEISSRLHSDYGNGKDYYKHHGERLLILPDSIRERPSREFLEWHNENVFLG